MVQKELYCLIEGMVHDIVRQLRGVRAVILFGSCAKGNPRWDSDIDLLVLVDHPKCEGFEVSHHPLGEKTVELTVASLELFRQELKAGNPFVLSVLQHGVVLYDDDCFEELKGGAAACPGDNFIFSQVAAARERLERGELRAAATYALNAQRLLENNLNLSWHLENLIGREITLEAQIVERWVKEMEAKVHGKRFS